jgi:hypothetical protein
MCFKNDWIITVQITEYGGKNNFFYRLGMVNAVDWT